MEILAGLHCTMASPGSVGAQAAAAFQRQFDELHARLLESLEGERRLVERARALADTALPRARAIEAALLAAAEDRDTALAMRAELVGAEEAGDRERRRCVRLEAEAEAARCAAGAAADEIQRLAEARETLATEVEGLREDAAGRGRVATLEAQADRADRFAISSGGGRWAPIRLRALTRAQAQRGHRAWAMSV